MATFNYTHVLTGSRSIQPEIRKLLMELMFASDNLTVIPDPLMGFRVKVSPIGLFYLLGAAEVDDGVSMGLLQKLKLRDKRCDVQLFNTWKLKVTKECWSAESVNTMIWLSKGHDDPGDFIWESKIDCSLRGNRDSWSLEQATGNLLLEIGGKLYERNMDSVKLPEEAQLMSCISAINWQSIASMYGTTKKGVGETDAD